MKIQYSNWKIRTPSGFIVPGCTGKTEADVWDHYMAIVGMSRDELDRLGYQAVPIFRRAKEAQR